jgi:hypothetical protein
MSGAPPGCSAWAVWTLSLRISPLGRGNPDEHQTEVRAALQVRACHVPALNTQ